jgi:hypothetical protein
MKQYIFLYCLSRELKIKQMFLEETYLQVFLWGQIKSEVRK